MIEYENKQLLMRRCMLLDLMNEYEIILKVFDYKSKNYYLQEIDYEWLNICFYFHNNTYFIKYCPRRLEKLMKEKELKEKILMELLTIKK